MSRAIIEFLFLPDKPLKNIKVKSKIEKDFEINVSLKSKIDDAWNEIKLLNPEVFSEERNLACLTTVYSKKEGVRLKFKYTDYKTYSALSNLSRKKRISEKSYEYMRVAAIGIVVFLGDDMIFIQRRSKKASHVPGIIDASCGGLCNVENNTINYLSCIYEKLKRELNLDSSEVIIKGISGIHSTNKPDLSGTVDFIVNAEIDEEEFIKRIKNNFDEFFIINKKELLTFILEHLNKDIGWEGVATLLTALTSKERQKLIGTINKNSKVIKFGKLIDNTFMEFS